MRGGPFFLGKERSPSRSPPKKAAWVFLSRRAESAPGRRSFAAARRISRCRSFFWKTQRFLLFSLHQFFCGGHIARGPFFQVKERAPRAPSKESCMGFPVPARGERVGTEELCGGEANQATPGFSRKGAVFSVIFPASVFRLRPWWAWRPVRRRRLWRARRRRWPGGWRFRAILRAPAQRRSRR